MTYNCKRLWKLLIDKGMPEITAALSCGLDDIIEITKYKLKGGKE